MSLKRKRTEEAGPVAKKKRGPATALQRLALELGRLIKKQNRGKATEEDVKRIAVIRSNLKLPKLERLVKGKNIRIQLHERLIELGVKKSLAKEILADVRHDLGVTKRKQRKGYRKTGLPPLTNPIPKFLAKFYKVLRSRAKKYYRTQIEAAPQFFEALGIIPPGTSGWRHLLAAALS